MDKQILSDVWLKGISHIDDTVINKGEIWDVAGELTKSDGKEVAEFILTLIYEIEALNARLNEWDSVIEAHADVVNWWKARSGQQVSLNNTLMNHINELNKLINRLK